jgi:hypothetical protein
MEFLHSINLIRRHYAFPFYALLVGLPLVLLTVIAMATTILPQDSSTTDMTWLNVYTVGMFGFMASVNFCFWKKMHWQRMGNTAKAKQWESAPNKLAIILFLSAILF